MPLARIFTDVPDRARDLRQALLASGYTVEVSSPAVQQSGPADLEIDLDRMPDLPNGAPVLVPLHHQTSFANDHAGDDTVEYIYDPDQVEREFVLAPIWRKLTAMFRRERPELVAQPVQDETPRPAPAPFVQREPQLVKPVAMVTPVPVVTPEIEEKKVAPPVVVHQETFISKAVEPAPPRLEPVKATPIRRPEVITEAAPREPRRDWRDPARQAWDSWKTAGASLAEAVGSRAAQAGTEMNTRIAAWKDRQAAVPREPHKRRSATRSEASFFARQLWPVAAGIALAFILGLTYARKDAGTTSPAQAAAPTPAVIVPPTHAVAKVAPKPAAAAVAQKRPTRRRVAREEDIAQDEVIIHHYPLKGEKLAKSQAQKSVRSYSDMN
jgi:hypothetical protein